MPGVTEREAVTRFLAPLNQALRCVTREPLLHLNDYRTGKTYSAGLRKPVKLQGQPLYRGVQFKYRIGTAESPEGVYKVFTEAYWHSLSDDHEQLIIGYHWDLRNKDHTYPHIHLGAGSKVGREELQKCHISSGRVAMESVLWLSLNDFHAKPLDPEWPKVLEKTQSAFEQHRSWDITPQA